MHSDFAMQVEVKVSSSGRRFKGHDSDIFACIKLQSNIKNTLFIKEHPYYSDESSRCLLYFF